MLFGPETLVDTSRRYQESVDHLVLQLFQALEHEESDKVLPRLSIFILHIPAAAGNIGPPRLHNVNVGPVRAKSISYNVPCLIWQYVCHQEWHPGRRPACSRRRPYLA